MAEPYGQRRGQNGADGHIGTTMEPFARQLRALGITLGIKPIGGHNQLFSPAQSTVKASTASDPGFQHQLLNLGT